MLVKSGHCTYFVFGISSYAFACLRPVRQVESRNKTSDIHRPFCPSLWSSSPWIKYKEDHRSFQKFWFAKEVLFFLSDTYYGRKDSHYRSNDMYFKFFPSGNSIGKPFLFTRFTKNIFNFLCTTKKHGLLIFHNNGSRESAAVLFICLERHTSSRLGRYSLNIKNWSVIQLPCFFM